MKLFLQSIVVLALTAICSLATAQAVPVPADWKETTTPHSRVLTKEKAQIQIFKWQNLQGLTIDAYLKKLEKTIPADAVYISSDGIKADNSQVQGVFVVSRTVEWNGQEGFSSLMGCPGQPGQVRIISYQDQEQTISSVGRAISAGKYMFKICEQKQKKDAIDSTNDDPISVVVAGITGRDPVKENAIAHVPEAEITTPLDSSLSSGSDRCTKTLAGRIRNKTLLKNSSAVCDYLLTGTLFVSSELIIEPGVTIRAAANVAIHVDEGSIIARGSATDPIVIDGTENTAGFWGGIEFFGGAASIFDHFHLMDAGQACFRKFCRDAGFRVNDVEVSITNSSVSNSAYGGMDIGSKVSLTAFSNNRFFGNRESGLCLHPELIPMLDVDSDYSGGAQPNGLPMVEVNGGGHSRGQVYQWKRLPTPYYIAEYLDPGGGLWKIDPGVEIVMSRDSWIHVKGNAVMEAIGTNQDPITIRGESSVSGYWDGIKLTDSTGVNTFKQVRVSDFGSVKNLAPNKAAFNVHESKLALEDVIISNGTGDGVRCNENLDYFHDGGFLRLGTNVKAMGITGVGVGSHCQKF